MMTRAWFEQAPCAKASWADVVHWRITLSGQKECSMWVLNNEERFWPEIKCHIAGRGEWRRSTLWSHQNSSDVPSECRNSCSSCFLTQQVFVSEMIWIPRIVVCGVPINSTTWTMEKYTGVMVLEPTFGCFWAKNGQNVLFAAAVASERLYIFWWVKL